MWADCIQMVPGYNIFFAFQTPVIVIEPNPNWRILCVCHYVTRHIQILATGPVTDTEGPTTP